MALLYARTGALNMAQIGAALDGHQADPLVIVAMVLLFLGFLTKAAAVPLHFWLADAHAVAPVPVCVLFSRGDGRARDLRGGAALLGGIRRAARNTRDGATRDPGRLGVLTAALGAFMCFVQRHVKRLLAFSTISHVGLFVCGVALLSAKALAGVAIYIVGHGLTKAALFMCAGVLLHRFRTDRRVRSARPRPRGARGWRALRGRGAAAGGAAAVHRVRRQVADRQAPPRRRIRLAGGLFVLVSALTGGAVLRVAGRVFLGWGPSTGPDPRQARAAQERVDETRDERDHTPPLMVLVPAVLLAGGGRGRPGPGAVPWVERTAPRFDRPPRPTRPGCCTARTCRWPRAAAEPRLADDVLTRPGVGSWARAAGRPGAVRTAAARGAAGGAQRVRRGAPCEHCAVLHSGHIGDYIAWWTAGASVLGGVCLLALR